jgi:hypothetical protein
VRFGIEGRGKRGGVRVIYFWAPEQGTLLMLYLFPKNVASDLTKAQLKILAKVVEEEFNE